jgi:hypothetical protein
MNPQTLSRIKKIDELLRSLSDLLGESDFFVFPNKNDKQEMPAVYYFEIIGQVFGMKTPAHILNN